jgi:hypothetical protein
MSLHFASKNHNLVIVLTGTHLCHIGSLQYSSGKTWCVRKWVHYIHQVLCLAWLAIGTSQSPPGRQRPSITSGLQWYWQLQRSLNPKSQKMCLWRNSNAYRIITWLWSILCVIPSSTRMLFRTFQLYNLQECAYEEIIMPNTSGNYCVEAEVEMNLKISCSRIKPLVWYSLVLRRKGQNKACKTDLNLMHEDGD